VILTFYSYKGGVGRSMALANVATWLRLCGLRVVMVDWDLEAPGLESFFFPPGAELEEIHGQLGLIDLLLSYQRLFPRVQDALNRAEELSDSAELPTAENDRRKLSAKVRVLDDFLPPLDVALHQIAGSAQPATTKGALLLLSAGWRSGKRFPIYAQAVQEFAWDGFYQRFEGQAYFEWMRRQLQKDDAIVLIDSRTGVTEMGGVCTRQMADVVVIFSAPNLQNLEGMTEMAASFRRSKLDEKRGRTAQIVMVPTRIDNFNPTRINLFQQEFSKATNDFTPPVFKTLKTQFWNLKIPYTPSYAYDESLAIGDPNTDKDLEESYKRLAAHLAVLAKPQSALRRQMSSEIGRIFGRLLPSVFILYGPGDRPQAQSLRARLEAVNISVWPDPLETLGPDAARSAVNGILDQAQFLVVAVTPDALRSADVRAAWRYARQVGAVVVPISAEPLDPAAVGPIPGWMSLVPIRAADQDWERIVAVLTAPNTAARVPFMVADVPSDHVLRGRELDRIKGFVMSGNTPRLALFGATGVGKSSLAAACARDDEVATAFADGVLWANAEADDVERKAELAWLNRIKELRKTSAALAGELVKASADARAEIERRQAEVERRLAAELDRKRDVDLAWQNSVSEALRKMYVALTGEQPKAAGDARAEIERRLSGKRCLIVIDGASTAERLLAFPLNIPGCQYLITTQDRAVAVAATATPVEISPLAYEEAEGWLQAVTTDRAVSADQIRNLIDAVGAVPGALKLATALLTANASTPTPGTPPLSLIDLVVAHVPPHTITTFQLDVLARLSEVERLRLEHLAMVPGGLHLDLAAVARLWKTDRAGALETRTRLADFALLAPDDDESDIRIHPWLRRLIALASPERLAAPSGDDLDKIYEAVYSQLSPDEAVRARQLLCRLVRVGDASESAVPESHPVAISDFSSDQSALVLRLEQLGLVVGRPPTQEVLIDEGVRRQWRRLREWVLADRQFLIWRQNFGAYLEDPQRVLDAEAQLKVGSLDAETRALLSDALESLKRRQRDLSPNEIAYIEERLLPVAARLSPAPTTPDTKPAVRQIAPPPSSDVPQRDWWQRLVATPQRIAVLVLVGALTVGIVFWLRQRLHQKEQQLIDACGDVKFRIDAWCMGKGSLVGFTKIEKGEFLMGSDLSKDRDAAADEQWSDRRTPGTLLLDEYYIGRYEVTVAEFRAFAVETHRPIGPNLAQPRNWPVASVSWYDARAFCAWLEEHLKTSAFVAAELLDVLRNKGWHVTLPSEAEWEKAARSDRQKRRNGAIYPWGDTWMEMDANVSGLPQPVGQIECPDCSNELSDMAGNVSEWTRSVFLPYPYEPGPTREDPSASSEIPRAVRGGSFKRDRRGVRAAARIGMQPGLVSDDVGFRVVISPASGF
jgi:formylglycine-generating enzyme required for sulfatase activity